MSRRHGRFRVSDLAPFRFFSVNCKYCVDKQLKPTRFRALQLPLMLLGIRSFRCPHCFESSLRCWLLWDTRCYLSNPELFDED